MNLVALARVVSPDLPLVSLDPLGRVEVRAGYQRADRITVSINLCSEVVDPYHPESEGNQPCRLSSGGPFGKHVRPRRLINVYFL